MAVKPIREGYHSLTPYFAVDDAASVIGWSGPAMVATS